MKLIDFSRCEESERHYGGNAGNKLGIIYAGAYWILKFPKATAGMRNMEISYTTSPFEASSTCVGG